jgi:hypothetical protein
MPVLAQLIWYYPFFGVLLYSYIVLRYRRYHFERIIKTNPMFNRINSWMAKLKKWS